MSCGDAQSGGHAECSMSLPNDNSKSKMSRLDQDLSAKQVAIGAGTNGSPIVAVDEVASALGRRRKYRKR